MLTGGRRRFTRRLRGSFDRLRTDRQGFIVGVRSRRRAIAATVMGVVLVAAASGCAVDLGPFGAQFSAASDINDRGDIVGAMTSPGTIGSYPTHAWFRPADGAMTVIDGGAYDSSAAAVNEQGTVVGTATSVSGGMPHAFRWTAAGGVVSLGTLGGPASTAVDINASGWIIGRSDAAGDNGYSFRHGFVRDPATGTMTELPRLPGYDFIEPSAINDDGVIVGTAYHELEYPISSRAVVWSAGTHAVAALPGLFSTATGVNAQGDIVGRALDLNAVVWDHATHEATSIPPLPDTVSMRATAINDDGTVVGQLQRGSAAKAFIWTADGGTRSLGGLGGSDAYVTAVNNDGVAVGTSQPSNVPWSHATRYDPD